MNTKLRLGFIYTVEVVDRFGRVTQREVKHNKIPLQGLNYLLSSQFKGTAVPATWYLAPYTGNYTPGDADTAATFPAAATETTSYNESTRVAFVPGVVIGGGVDNVAAPALFTFNTANTVYGGFMTSASAKVSGAGTLLSAVRFDSPKSLDIGSVLRLSAGFTFASA